MPTEPSMDEMADGLSLWDEHKPQSGEDWLAVAERFVAAGETIENSSPLFAALVLAVEREKEARQRWEQEVRERLEALDWQAINSAAEAQCPSRDHRPLACAQCVTDAALSAIFGEAEPVEDSALDAALEMQAPIELTQGQVPEAAVFNAD